MLSVRNLIPSKTFGHELNACAFVGDKYRFILLLWRLCLVRHWVESSLFFLLLAILIMVLLGGQKLSINSPALALSDLELSVQKNMFAPSIMASECSKKWQ